MIVFLQHTDPVLPRYRKKAWNFKLGALSTMDRDFLGWQGQFFLHNVSVLNNYKVSDTDQHTYI